MPNKLSSLNQTPASGVLQALPSAASMAPFEVGEIIGDKYVFERIIAEGGMAVVVAAQHQELGETVAVKVLKPAMLVDRDLVTRFAREAKTTVRVRSEYSVKVLDVGVDARRGPFMVMECLKGEDLRAIIDREGRLSERRAAEMAMQACEALGAAHVLGIIHRDVKPENIFVTSDGGIDSIRVLDFGISKAALTGSVMNTDISLVKTQMLMGSPIYMAPEQMRSSSHVDGRADIWALGITLYELLSGKPPFIAESVTNLCALVLETRPVHLSQAAPGIHPEFASVVMRCLSKDPESRFANVGELATALLPFAPSRARISAERLVSKFAEIGVTVTPPSRASTAPPAHPKSDEVPVTLGEGRVSVRDKTQILAVTAEKEQQKKRGILIVLGIAAAVAAIGFVVLRPSPKPATPAITQTPDDNKASLTTIPRPALPSEPASADTKAAGESTGSAAVQQKGRTAVPWVPVVRGAKPHSSAPETAPPPAEPQAPTKTERVKVLDDGPKVKVLE